MRRPVRVGRPLVVVVVVVDAGMFAMTAEIIVAGDTPRVPDDAQPVRDGRATAAIAPTLRNGGVIMIARQKQLRRQSFARLQCVAGQCLSENAARRGGEAASLRRDR